VKIFNTQDKLIDLDDDNNEKKMELNEYIADNYAAVLNYSEAINHYLRSLKVQIASSSLLQ